MRFEEMRAKKKGKDPLLTYHGGILAKMKGCGTGNAPRLVEDFCIGLLILGQIPGGFGPQGGVKIVSFWTVHERNFPAL
jgi:hypothetical protein